MSKGKGKKELYIEVAGNQILLVDFKKLLENKLKDAGFKYSEDVKMYFNVSEKIVYAVSKDGKQLQIKF